MPTGAARTHFCGVTGVESQGFTQKKEKKTIVDSQPGEKRLAEFGAASAIFVLTYLVMRVWKRGASWLRNRGGGEELEVYTT